MANAVQSRNPPVRKRLLPASERLRELFDYEPLTGRLVWRSRAGRNWARTGHEAGHLRDDGYRDVRVDGALYLTHRIIWKLVTGSEPVAEIDHRNGDRANNKWCNLRAATRVENCRNTRIPANASGFRGVSIDRRCGRWRASIKIDGKQKHLGYFAAPELAHAAYEKAAASHFGTFAKAARGE